MTDLRRLAAGKPCMIRLPGICNFDATTTVLAHYRLIGISGMGIKSPDLIGAWACSNCHDAVDGRIRTPLERDSVHLAHLEGMVRTLVELQKLEVLQI